MENKLVQVIRICSLDILINYLDYLDQTQICCRPHDLLNLLRCCTGLQKLLTVKITKLVTFKYSIIHRWTKKTNIHRLYIDADSVRLDYSILPPNLVHLDFGIMEMDLKNCYLPDSLKSIHFGFSFNQYLDNSSLPKNLTKIIFGSMFNQFLDKNVLPDNLTELIFDSYSRYNNTFVRNVLPKSLVKLTLGYKFNQPIYEDVLPCSLKYLKFGSYFNQNIVPRSLPENLEHLIFGERFNQQILANTLPFKLTHLTFGESWNPCPQFPISDNIFPPGLIELNFGQSFNRAWDKFMYLENMKNLKKLSIGRKFTQKLSIDVLPENLQVLTLSHHTHPVVPESVFLKIKIQYDKDI